MSFIYDLHKLMHQRNMVMIYEGEFTQEITRTILRMTEQNMEAFNEASAVQRKVYNLMMECMQNIQRHARNHEPDREGFKNNAIFIIGKREEEYYLVSGNVLTRTEIENIASRIDEVNALDDEGISELFKKAIKKADPSKSENGGAGLGFIDMRKKSGETLGYDFEHVDEELSFFSFMMRVSRIKKERKKGDKASKEERRKKRRERLMKKKQQENQ